MVSMQQLSLLYVKHYIHLRLVDQLDVKKMQPLKGLLGGKKHTQI
jgi:hypothetical protein